MTGNTPASSGVYKITCLANKKIYIGSALHLCNRRRRHFNVLRQNKHENPYLQRAWNKYGEQAFTFEVLEQVLPISLTAREQYWLNKLKPFGRRGFNILHEAGSALGMKHTPEALEKMRGRKLSPEHIEKVRRARLGQKQSAERIEKNRQSQLGKKMSPEAREKIGRANRGKTLSPETREKVRQAKIGNSYNLGKKHSPETIEKMRQAKQRKGNTYGTGKTNTTAI